MRKKKLRTRTKFVIVSMVAIIVYTIADFVLLFMQREVDTTLTVAWFAAWTTELALLAGIKIKDKGDD